MLFVWSEIYFCRLWRRIVSWNVVCISDCSYLFCVDYFFLILKETLLEIELGKGINKCVDKGRCRRKTLSSEETKDLENIFQNQIAAVIVSVRILVFKYKLFFKYEHVCLMFHLPWRDTVTVSLPSSRSTMIQVGGTY